MNGYSHLLVDIFFGKPLIFLKNPSDLHLFKEGVFWVAYEHNAYFIWKMKGYKPNKKYIKSIQQEVVSV